MSTQSNTAAERDPQLLEAFEELLGRYYADPIGALAQNYPRDQESLWIDYQDLLRYDVALADDLLDQPGLVKPHLEEAGIDRDRGEHEIGKLKSKGELYWANPDHLRTT